MYNVTLTGADQEIPRRERGSKEVLGWFQGYLRYLYCLGLGVRGGGTQPPSPDDISQGLTQDVISIINFLLSLLFSSCSINLNLKKSRKLCLQ